MTAARPTVRRCRADIIPAPRREPARRGVPPHAINPHNKPLWRLDRSLAGDDRVCHNGPMRRRRTHYAWPLVVLLIVLLVQWWESQRGSTVVPPDRPMPDPSAAPGVRMKMGREHRVTLAAPAVAILAEMARLGTEPDRLVFPGLKPTKPMSDMTLTAVLKRMKREDKERWEHYQLTGEYVPHEKVAAWLKDVASGKRGPCPR